MFKYISFQLFLWFGLSSTLSPLWKSAALCVTTPWSASLVEIRTTNDYVQRLLTVCVSGREDARAAKQQCEGKLLEGWISGVKRWLIVRRRSACPWSSGQQPPQHRAVTKSPSSSHGWWAFSWHAVIFSHSLLKSFYTLSSVRAHVITGFPLLL